MEVDLSKETAKVKEACDHVVAGFNVWQTMDEAEKERFEALLELILPAK